MVTHETLVSYLHDKTLTHSDKLLIILNHINCPTNIEKMKRAAQDVGFNEIKKWNVSSKLSSIREGYAIRNTHGWQITKAGKDYLLSKGLVLTDKPLIEQASLLRSLIKSLDNDAKKYLEEAIVCMENELHRASVVMTWSAAMHFLKKEVVNNHLHDFNTESVKANPKWRTAKTSDDLGLMRERDFLDRLENISLIGKDVKQQLQECLSLRNSCGHPNSLKVEKLKVASFVETLILNVFQRFCA